MAEAARSATEIHAGARDPDRRRRGGRRPPSPRPPPPGPLGQGSATNKPSIGAGPRGGDTDVGGDADLDESRAAATGADAATGAGAATGADAATGAGAATGADRTTGADADVSKAADAPASAAVGPGSGRAATASARALGRIAPSSVSSWLAVGRLLGCLARQLSTSRRSSSGRSPSSAGLLIRRYINLALDPEPNGPYPLAANTSTAPRLKMSLAGPMSWPRACSGDKNPGEPKSSSGSALASSAGQILKSTSRGLSSASRTFEGLRFRCTTPAACRARRPSASPAASVSTISAGSGPWSRTVSASDGPSTYAVASHGTGPSRSASSTGAIKAPLTSRAAATSARKPGSTATSAGTTVTATRSPSGERPRNRPLRPSCPSSSYGPTVLDTSVVSGTTTLIPPTPTGGKAIPTNVSGNTVLRCGLYQCTRACRPGAARPTRDGRIPAIVLATLHLAAPRHDS